MLLQLLVKSRRAGKRPSPVITGPFLKERHLLAPLSPIVFTLSSALPYCAVELS